MTPAVDELAGSGLDDYVTLWGAETRVRAVSRRSVPSVDALHALVDGSAADPSVGPPKC